MKRAVCVCRYQGKYIFSYNKKREGFEIPGGHIEKGENWYTMLRGNRKIRRITQRIWDGKNHLNRYFAR